MNKDRTSTSFGDKLGAVHVKMAGITEEDVRRVLASDAESVTKTTVVTVKVLSVDMEEGSHRPDFASTQTA